MEQNKTNEGSMESLFAAWTKSVTDFWADMTKMQVGMPTATAGASEKFRKNPLYQAQKNWEIANKMWQSGFSSLTDPESMKAALEGMDSLPEFVTSMVGQTWDGYLELQKKWTEQMSKLGQHTEAYTFEELDQTLFKGLREIYEKEFQKFLNVPQLGLTRFQQERFNRFMDKYNLYQTAVNEFIYMFYIPVEKSAAVMQEKIEQMADQGEFYHNFKDYYNAWIKILEGHYMTLLKSPEYTQIMDSTINALVEYRQAKDEMLYDILQKLPIPTNRDMDELYKDFYLLKKQVKELSKKVNSEKNEK